MTYGEFLALPIRFRSWIGKRLDEPVNVEWIGQPVAWIFGGIVVGWITASLLGL